MSFRLNPITRRRFRRFRSLRRGWWSFLAFVALLGISALAELLINSRALVVRYEGRFYFPTYTAFHPGTDFGENYHYEVNYRQIAERFRRESKGDWVLLPPVPYNPYENSFREGRYPPAPPSAAERHFLGTDTAGRDVLARLIYGFRTAITFSLVLVSCSLAVGIAVGCAMGYFGGAVDLIGQRLIELWSHVPVLYVLILISSIVVPNIGLLLIIMLCFSWTGATYGMRSLTYREKERDYVAAAIVIGASTPRIIFRHILPNTLSLLITGIPFAVAGGITALTGLDFLGYGLPPPTPSWGELLKQGTANLNAPWIIASVFCGLVLVLTLVTFTGEAVREAFDPKRFTIYE